MTHEVMLDPKRYEELCKKWGQDPLSPRGLHAELVRRMEECGTKNITPRDYAHPRNPKELMHGIRLGIGAILCRATDHIDSDVSHGKWLPIPKFLAGAVLRDDFQGIFIRQVKK